MPTAVADATKFLGRWCDVLGLVGLFPVIAHAKLGKLLAVRDAAKRSDGAEAEAKAVTEGESPPRMPPVYAFVLLAVAEVLEHARLFDPSNPEVKKSVGAMVRAQKKWTKTSGAEESLATLVKTIDQDDVFSLLSPVVYLASLVALGAHAACADEGPQPGDRTFNLFKVVQHSLAQAVKAVFSPQLLFVLPLLVAFVVGNWSALGTFAARPTVMEVLRSLSLVVRAIGIASAVVDSPKEGPVSTWAALQGGAALARASQFFVYERLSLSELLGKDPGVVGLLEGSARILSARCTLALDIWCFLISLPCALTKRRSSSLVLTLVAPAFVLAGQGPTAERFAPYVGPASAHLATTFALCGVLLVFLGGFFNMMAVVGLIQGFTLIHKLDKVKF
jgi:hypothetical protein